MTAKIISVANMKGGVGKTTTVVSLAEGLSADDRNTKILVIDLDPQASASCCIAGDEILADLITRGHTIDVYLEQRLIRGEPSSFGTKIHRIASDTTHAGYQLRISLLACAPYLRLVEREIIYDLANRDFGVRGIEGQIWRLISNEMAQLADRYDYIIFDCAPGISPLTEVAIRMSDLVIVPTIADYLSTLGLNAFCRSLWSGPNADRTSLPRPSRLPRVLVTRWQQQVRQQNEVFEGMKVEVQSEDAGFELFDTKIPQAAALVDALTLSGSAPTFRGKYGPLVCNILQGLVREVKGVLRAH